MENHEFDQLARNAAEGQTRRTIVRGLAATLGAAGLGVGLALQADAEKSKKAKRRQKRKRQEKRKEKKYECDSKDKVCAAPINPCQTVACENHKCVTSNVANGTTCGNGLECNAGQCLCPNGVCVVKVTPTNMGGWVFYDDNIDKPAATTMEFGPAIPQYGTGSALLEVPDETKDKMISAHIYNGTPLADFDELQYRVYVKSTSQGIAPSLQLGIDFDPDDQETGWQGRMVFSPSLTGPINTGAWQTFDVTDDDFGDGSGNWWFTKQNFSGGKCPQSNPCTWSEVLAHFPKIRIHPQGPDDKPGAGIGFIGMKVGRDVATSANVDGLQIKLKGNGASTTIYNFDPNS